MKQSLKLTGIAPQMVVSDVVASAEYYRDYLGFKILGYFLEPPVYSMVERDGIQIHFGKTDGESVQKSNTALRKVGFDVYIWVSDVNKLFQEYSLNHVEIEEPLVDRIYGIREFAIRDCHGFKITFGQSI